MIRLNDGQYAEFVGSVYCGKTAADFVKEVQQLFREYYRFEPTDRAVVDFVFNCINLVQGMNLQFEGESDLTMVAKMRQMMEIEEAFAHELFPELSRDYFAPLSFLVSGCDWIMAAATGVEALVYMTPLQRLIELMLEMIKHDPDTCAESLD